MFSMVLVGSGYVSFDTDPDSGSSHFFKRIRIQGNTTDSTDPDPDPQHCGGSHVKNFNSHQPYRFEIAEPGTFEAALPPLFQSSFGANSDSDSTLVLKSYG